MVESDYFIATTRCARSAPAGEVAEKGSPKAISLRSAIRAPGILVLVILLLFPLTTTAQILGSNATSLCAELIRPVNYTCHEYNVTTNDGFILGLQNIPFPRGLTHSNATNRSVVILQHGVLAGGETWVLNNPQESLAFILADAGFDVWIANNRNVQWSHGHIFYKPTDNGYWNWTSDELASFDLEASTKFIYNHTGRKKVFYVGHSQGTLVLLAGLTGGAYKTEVLSYLKGAVLMAPIAFVRNITAVVTRAGLSAYTDVLLPIIGVQELNPQPFQSLVCTLILIGSTACNDFLTGLLGPANYLNQTRLPYYTNYYPQPTSSLNFNHFGQALRTATFEFYDYGYFGNLAAYNRTTPPPYDLTTFPSTLPIQLWTGGIDGLADPADVATLLQKLPSANRTVTNLPTYGHLDSILGTRAYLDIYPELIQFFNSQ